MSHARLSCSGASRWSKCPGSVREETNYPDSPGDAAIDGTGSHLLLELVLGEAVPNAFDYVGQTIGVDHEDKPEGWEVDKARAERVQIAVDYVAKRMEEIGPSCVREIEVKSNPGARFGRNDWWGTVDIVLSTVTFTEIIDYKDGHVFVSEHSPQLISYAKGRQNASCETMRRTIIQPKTTDPVRFIDSTADEVSELAKELFEAAKLTDDPEAPLIPGDHCKWCKHIDQCTPRNETAVQAINGPVNPLEMTVEQIAQVIDATPLIETFIKAVEKEAIKRIESGEDVPGYAVVTGNGPNPKWIDPEEALKKLKGMRYKLEERTSSKIITPTQALKLKGLTEIQKANIEKLIIRGKGKPTLKRMQKPKLTAQEMFGDESQEIDAQPEPVAETQPTYDFW